MSSILGLPLEIHYSIYEYTLDWPNPNNAFKTTKTQTQQHADFSRQDHSLRCAHRTPSVEGVSTPTVLLLNRQITTKAQDSLL